MIVGLPTLSQAARVAAVTGGRHLPAKEEGKLSRRVDVGAGFEGRRGAVESVSVLFRLLDENGVEAASGWTISAAKFEVCWPGEPGVVRSHFGARRFAFNWALGQVKADVDARKGTLSGRAPAGTWRRCESAGTRSKTRSPRGGRPIPRRPTPRGSPIWSGHWPTGRRPGPAPGRAGTGFPAFRSRRRDHNRVRFTTGAWSLTGVPSPSRSSEPCARRRTPAAWSGTCAGATPGSCR